MRSMAALAQHHDEDAGLSLQTPRAVLLVDDRRLERDALATAIETAAPGCRVDAVADVRAATEYLQRRPGVDVALVDCGIIMVAGMRCLHGIGRAGRRTRIIALSAYFEAGVTAALREAGAHGAFSTSIGVTDLVDRMARIVGGEVIFELPKSDERKAMMRQHFELTEREYEILEMLGEGAGNADIARRLDIAESTVRVHVHRVMRKMGADTRFHVFDRLRRLDPRVRLWQRAG